jgi:hypothetical protein
MANYIHNFIRTTKFTRGEIITLFNAFGRLSESIMSTQNFRDFYTEQKHKSNKVKVLMYARHNNIIC